MASLQEAVSSIPDDACIALGGFDIVRAPMSLVFELARRGGKRLEVVSPPNPLAIDLLIGVGSVRRATLAFSGFQFDGGFAVGRWSKAVELDHQFEVTPTILTGLGLRRGVRFCRCDIDGSGSTSIAGTG
jgi:acyl CoA:acetate/3-ketoacid CoA transferase alpha subunit